MPLQLNTVPANGGTLAFGTVPVAGSATLTIHVAVTGGINHVDEVSWNWDITGPNAADFTPNPFGDTTVQAEPANESVVFSPSSPGAKTATLTITSSDAFNTPIVIHLTGNAAAGGFLTLSPQTTNDFGSVQDGTDSGVLNVLVQNNSGTDVIVTAITFNGDFSAGGALPGLPFTQHANTVDPAVVIPVKFHPTLTGFHVTANAVEVTSNATNNPTDQAMQGTGVILTPAFTVSLQPQAVLMAFVTAGGTSVVLEMDATDLDTEEPGSFKRIYDWTAPLMEKYLGRVILRYEDESATPFDYTVTCVAPRLPSPVTDSVINQGGANDELIHNSFADLQISDDLIQIIVSRVENDGPMQITEIFHEVDKRGEVIEAA